MGNKLYVGNLPYGVRDNDLEQAFSAFGSVTSAKVMMERDTGRSKGFGFVEMGSDAEAQAAINGMNGQSLGGRAIVVNEARPDGASPPLRRFWWRWLRRRGRSAAASAAAAAKEAMAVVAVKAAAVMAAEAAAKAVSAAPMVPAPRWRRWTRQWRRLRRRQQLLNGALRHS